MKIARSSTRPCALDLSTVRETLAYVLDDVRRAPGLERAAVALAAALAEIEQAERNAACTRRRAHALFVPLRSRP